MKKLAPEKQQFCASFTGKWGQLELSPEKAVWWPDQRILLIADLHLGKEATFRRHGLAVPEGATAKTLMRASDLIAHHKPTRTIILGDLFHARTSLSTLVVSSFAEFLNRHSGTEFTLVKGNHDIHTGTLPAAWDLEVVDPPLTIASVMLTHYPQPPAAGSELTIAGHLHPAARLRGDFSHAGKLPCFALSDEKCLTLPAFGEFVGTSQVLRNGTSRIWLVTTNRTLEAPTQLLKP